MSAAVVTVEKGGGRQDDMVEVVAMVCLHTRVRACNVGRAEKSPGRDGYKLTFDTANEISLSA